jgi:hypothetical protein
MQKSHTRGSMSDQLKQAIVKAQENAKLAAKAKTEKDRNYYDRMHRKWMGIADGWRVIDEIDQVHSPVEETKSSSSCEPRRVFRRRVGRVNVGRAG